MKTKIISFLLLFIICLLIHLELIADAHEYADTVRITSAQAYKGSDSNLLSDFAKNLTFNKDHDFTGITCTVKIYFDQQGRISDINIESKTPLTTEEIIDSISNALRKLPGWNVGSSPILTRMYVMKLNIEPNLR